MSERNDTKSFDPYTTDGGKAYHEEIYGGVGARGYKLIARWRVAKIQPYVEPSDHVLEFGVGPGWNLARLEAARRRGYDVASALRPSVEAEGIEFTDEITREDFEAYDVVICSHVLEHLPNPGEALGVIMNCLKPQGKALLYVPLDIGHRFKTYDPKEPNHHLFSWNVQSFINFITFHGLAVSEHKLRPFGYERIIAIWVERLHLPDWAYPFLVRLALLLKPDHEISVVVIKK